MNVKELKDILDEFPDEYDVKLPGGSEIRAIESCESNETVTLWDDDIPF